MEKFKRSFFRLELNNQPLNFSILSQTRKGADEKSRLGEIKDISGGGLSFRSKENLGVDSSNHLVAKLNFKLDGRAFDFECTILRQEKTGDYYLYGVKFDNVLKKDRSRLATILLKYDLIERKKRIEVFIKERENKK